MDLNSALDLLAGVGTGLMVFFLAILVFNIIVNWIIFTKAGQPGWAILIPVFNLLVMLRVAGKPWWWIFIFLAFPVFLIPILGQIVYPIVILVFMIMMFHGISKNFGQGAGFTVGLIFLGTIFRAILAFGKYEWNKV